MHTPPTYAMPVTYRPWRRSQRSGYLAWGAMVGAVWASAAALVLLLAASVNTGAADVLARAETLTLQYAPQLPTEFAAHVVVAATWLVTALVLSVGVSLARPTPVAGSRMLSAGAGLASGCALLPLVLFVSERYLP